MKSFFFGNLPSGRNLPAIAADACAMYTHLPKVAVSARLRGRASFEARMRLAVAVALIVAASSGAAAAVTLRYDYTGNVFETAWPPLEGAHVAGRITLDCSGLDDCRNISLSGVGRVVDFSFSAGPFTLDRTNGEIYPPFHKLFVRTDDDARIVAWDIAAGEVDASLGIITRQSIVTHDSVVGNLLFGSVGWMPGTWSPPVVVPAPVPAPLPAAMLAAGLALLLRPWRWRHRQGLSAAPPA